MIKIFNFSTIKIWIQSKVCEIIKKLKIRAWVWRYSKRTGTNINSSLVYILIIEYQNGTMHVNGPITAQRCPLQKEWSFSKISWSSLSK